MKNTNRKDKLELKDKFKRKAMALSIIAIISSSVLWYSTSSLAGEKIEVSENTIGLNVEKIDKDTVKISLDNFKDVAKSMQLSVKIDGNVVFEENTIKWLVNSSDEGIKSNFKLSDDKKVMDMFIVSNSSINKVSGNIDICEIDVSKNGLGDSSYRVIPNINNDGASYTYVLSDTNKQARGNDIVNLSEEKLTINTAPTIKLLNSSSIVEGNIVISKGSEFNPNDFVIATDEEDGEIKDIKVEGKINNNIVGSYGIKYIVNDSQGDIASLSTSVIVEESVNITEKPVIKGTRETVTIKTGEIFEPLAGVSATDYLGRNIEVVVSGDYNVDVVGTYIIKYNATDRLNNKAQEKITTLIVEKSEEPEVPDVTPEVPDVKPEVPDVKPEVPDVKPEVPDVKPEVPDVKPEVPDVKPEVPDVKPEVPDVKPEVPDVKPEVPDVKPEVPDVKPEVPDVKPEVPDVKPEVPDTKPEVPGNPENKFEIPNQIIDIIDINIVTPISGNGKNDTPLLLDIKDVTVDELNTILVNFENFNVRVEKVIKSDEYTIFTVSMEEKSGLFRIKKNIYLELRVNNSKTELLTRLNKFAVDNGLEVSGNTEKPIKPELPGNTEKPIKPELPGNQNKPGNEVDTKKPANNTSNNILPATGQVVGTTVLFGLGGILMGCGLYFTGRKKKR